MLIERQIEQKIKKEQQYIFVRRKAFDRKNVSYFWKCLERNGAGKPMIEILQHQPMEINKINKYYSNCN